MSNVWIQAARLTLISAAERLRMGTALTWTSVQPTGQCHRWRWHYQGGAMSAGARGRASARRGGAPPHVRQSSTAVAAAATTAAHSVQLPLPLAMACVGEWAARTRIWGTSRAPA